MLLLSPALLVALLPLLGRPAAQRGAAPPADGARSSQPAPRGRVTRGQASRQSGGAAPAAHSPQQGQQQAEAPRVDVAALEGGLLSLLPLVDLLGARLVEAAEEGSGRPGGTTSSASRSVAPGALRCGIGGARCPALRRLPTLAPLACRTRARAHSLRTPGAHAHC